MNHSKMHVTCACSVACLMLSFGCAAPSKISSVRSQASLSKVSANKSEPTVRTIAYLDSDSKAGKSREDISTIAIVHAEETILPLEQVSVASVPGYTLADIEMLALKNNPAIAAAAEGASVAAALRQQVGLRPNPTIGYWGSQLADQKTDQHGAFIDQEFVRGNKLALNQDVLRHTVNAQRWEAETQRRRVLTDVRMRFYEALAAQRQLDATREFSKVADRGVEVANIRFEAKEGSLIEVLQSKTLMSEVQLAEQQSEAAFLGSWKDLTSIAGIADLPPAKLLADFETQSEAPDWETAYNTIINQSPELGAANALVCEKHANLKRQQAQPIPNVNVQFQSGYDRATDSGMINLQVGAPIPAFNNNSGNISAAFSEYKRAIDNRKRIELAIRSRLARAAQEYETAFAAVQKYETEIVPQAKQTLDLSEEGYRAGELDFLQVLVVRRVYYESTIRLIASQSQLAQATAKVDGLLLVGGLDAPQDFTTGDGLRGQTFGGQ